MILWVRHGQSTWNILGRMQGHTNHPPLTDLGRRQSVVAAEQLAQRGVTAIVSSPALRATQTATIIAGRLGLNFSVDPLLAEKGLDEPTRDVLVRIDTFLAKDLPDVVVAVSHGDTIGLVVETLTGQPAIAAENCSITTVIPGSRTIESGSPLQTASTSTGDLMPAPSPTIGSTR